MVEGVMGSPNTKLTSLLQPETMASCPSWLPSVLSVQAAASQAAPVTFLGLKTLPHPPFTASYTSPRDTGQPHSRYRQPWDVS